jgi:alpha-glucosidase
MKEAIDHVIAGIRTLGLGRSLLAGLYPLRRAYYEAKFSTGDKRGSVLRGLAGLLTALRHQAAEQRFGLHDVVLLGDVLSHSREAQAVTVLCQNASLQLTVLAADLVRVRLSPVRTGRCGPVTAGRCGPVTAGRCGPVTAGRCGPVGAGRFGPVTAGRCGTEAAQGVPEDAFLPIESYAIARPDNEWAVVPYTLTATPDAIEISTARLTCRIAKRPCSLSFWDAKGQRIHGDSLGLGWKQEKVVHFSTLAPDEHVYGLGEKAFPLDRRGRSYLMWNTDPQNYSSGDDPIYLNIPFYIGLREGQAYGVFYDNPYRSRFDLGKTRPDEAIYVADDGELCYYFFYGPALTTILERYTDLTGRMPLPPLWALGYQQSRWSYYPESRVREIARLFREHHIPCDALHLDIHYMDGYRCFTWDKQRFSDPSALLTELHKSAFRVVVVIDCGIKADRAYRPCADGLARDAFCTYPDGTIAGGPVWPGECYFPDFTSPGVREWWAQLHASLVETGVDGIWNDMNEPTVIGPRGDTLASCVRHDWEGKGADHRQAHNVYGMQMVRATGEGLQRLRPNERPFVLTRSGWAGVQRYALSWTADTESTWEHLRLSIAMVMGLGLSGLAFTGPDIGGFDGDADAELLVRWTQLGSFLPFFRNHTSLFSRDQEPWAYGEPYLGMNRSAIELRYRLLPYLYTATWQCVQSGHPIARPVLWAYPEDPHTYSLDDEFLCGDSLLVAPICEAGATSRQVYLPAGGWFDFWTDERHAGPTTVEVPAPLERIPVFVRAGAVLPTWPVMQHTGQPVERLILQVYPGHGDSWLYEDDGHSLAYQQGQYRATRFESRYSGGTSLAIVRHVQGEYRPSYTRWEWNVHALTHTPQRVLADGQSIENPTFDQSRRVLRFDSDENQRIGLSW